MGYVEDAHFSAPAKPTPAQIAGRQPYAGGFASDDGEDCYLDNTGPPDASILTPLRLPRDLARAEKQMGDVHDTGEFSEEEGTDYSAMAAGYASVTPLHLDLTDYRVLDGAEALRDHLVRTLAGEAVDAGSPAAPP